MLFVCMGFVRACERVQKHVLATLSYPSALTELKLNLKLRVSVTQITADKREGN